MDPKGDMLLSVPSKRVGMVDTVRDKNGDEVFTIAVGIDPSAKDAVDMTPFKFYSVVCKSSYTVVNFLVKENAVLEVTAADGMAYKGDCEDKAALFVNIEREVLSEYLQERNGQ